MKDVDSHTILRLQTKDGETWTAVRTAAVKKDAEATIENDIVRTYTDFGAKNACKVLIEEGIL